jgi:hypothetical protein
MNRNEILLRRIRLLLFIFVTGLVLSGVTAIPLETELDFLTRAIHANGGVELQRSEWSHWFDRIRDALVATNAKYPFIAYGTDWLAFAHFVIAILFIGSFRDPVKNIWVIEFGIISCALVVPFALVMGSVRGIPLGWQLIDASFGLLGIIPLWLCRRLVRQLAESKSNAK